jgi:arginine deiminase
VTPRDTAPDDGRTFVLDRVCTPENLGPSLVDPVRELFEDLDGKTLAEYLVGGVLKSDLQPSGTHSLKWGMLRSDDFVLAPLPNHLFQRDNSCWICHGVTGNPMTKQQWGKAVTIALRHQNHTDRTCDPVMTANTRTFDSIGIL